MVRRTRPGISRFRVRCFASPRNDGVCSNSKHAFATPRRDAPGSCIYLPPKEGVGNAGCPLHPRPRVRLVVMESTRVTTSTPESPGIPARNGFTAYFVLSPVTGLFCHRRLRTDVVSAPGRADPISATLTPASGRQDHTTSPYVATSLVSVLLIAHGPFDSPCDPIAHQTLPRPPHPVPYVRDDRETPLCVGRDTKGSRCDLGGVKTKIFLQRGLDTPVNEPPDGQITGLRREQIPLVSRTRCSVLHAAPQSRNPRRIQRHAGHRIAAHHAAIARRRRA